MGFFWWVESPGSLEISEDTIFFHIINIYDYIYICIYIYNLHYIEISIIYPTFCFACKWGYWVFMGI